MSKYIGIHCTENNGEKVISILKNNGIITTGFRGIIHDGYYVLDTDSKRIVDCFDNSQYKNFIKEESCIDADMRLFNLDDTLIKEMISRSINKSIIPFLERVTADKSQGGFNWSFTPEGHKYWKNLILEGSKLETDNKLDKNENRLQKKTVNLTRGERDTGRTICYRQSKIAVTVGYLSHQEISC